MKTIYRFRSLHIILLAALFLVACGSQADGYAAIAAMETPAESTQIAGTSGGIAAVETPAVSPENGEVNLTLKTIINNGGFAFLGIGGEIDGVVNPDLIVQPGDVLRITLLNGDGMPHDLYFPDLDAKTPYVSKVGEETEIVVKVGDVQPGTYVYYCTVPGHRQAGQEGKLVIKP